MYVTRCPYCVQGNEFREMAVGIDGRMICTQCDHQANPRERDFKCQCPKCHEIRLPAGLGYLASILGEQENPQ
jgi:hypothetical protein